eukprot:gene10881-3585_t
MREKLKIPKGDVLQIIHQYGDSKKQEAFQIIHEMEEEGNIKLQFQPEIEVVLSHLKKKKIPIGLLTRNSEASTKFFLEKLYKTHKIKNVFDPIISREFQMEKEFRVKPHPYSLEYISNVWKIPAENILMVGDSIHDIKCGINAGTQTCYFNSNNIH